MSFFAPTTTRELNALMRHLDSEPNRLAIRQRQQDPDYLQATSRLREFHRNLYANISDANIMRPQGRCPWETSGLKAECERVATAHQVPIWRVLGAANSAAEHCVAVDQP